MENNPTKYVDPSGNSLVFAGPIFSPEETIAHGETLAAVLLPDPNNAFDMTCLMMGTLGPEGAAAGEVGIVGRKAVTKIGEELVEHSGSIKRVLEGTGKAKFKSLDLFTEHYEKHVIKRGEFGYISKQKYLQRAQDLVSSKPGGDILSKTRSNGDRLFYNKATNEFGVVDKNNNLKTFFKPEDGIKYYNGQ